MERLKEPWGECTDSPADLHPGEAYTRNRCIRACQTHQVQQRCDCKDAYMPGTIHKNYKLFKNDQNPTGSAVCI